MTAAVVAAAALGVGVVAVAVLDALAWAAVAGQPLRAAVTRPVREAAVLLVQQRTTTERPDREAWALGAAGLAAMAASGAASVPLADGFAATDVDDGIVLFGAAMAMVMVAVFLHGWSANSLFPLFGAYRFVALALSYEMPLALVLIGAALPAESLSVGAIIESQAALWNVVRQPLGLPLFLVTVAGVSFWGPLGVADAADIGGGTSAEVSGSALLAWRASRAAVLVAASAMAAAAFLGGWYGPLLPGSVWMALKTLAVAAVIVASAHLLPRVRLERFVVVAWVVLIPLALVDVFAAGLVAL